MSLRRKFAPLAIIKRVPIVALLMLLFIAAGLNSEAERVKEPASVFRPALKEIQSRVRIPILLPSQLPTDVSERGIRLASGAATDDGYFISLYFSDIGTDASFAAGFGGSIHLLQELPGTRRVALSGHRTALFRPVTCGGSCAPANLCWKQNGVMYQIQLKFSSEMPEISQEKVLADTANSCVIVYGANNRH